ncbi:MAG: chemotaxis protein CheB [Planctomycetota bacterium]
MLAGAYDCVEKPHKPTRGESVMTLTRQLSPRVQSLYEQVGSVREPLAGITGILQRAFGNTTTRRAVAYDQEQLVETGRDVQNRPLRLVVIAAGAGGPAAIREMLPTFSKDFPLPILVVQHLRPELIGALVERLDDACDLPVVQLENQTTLAAGSIYVAKGGMQLAIESTGTESSTDAPLISQYYDDPAEHGNAPSLDYLLRSLQDTAPEGVLVSVLSGIGFDGCDGAKHLMAKGSIVFAQHPEGCTVFSTPKSLIANNLADRILPLSDMAYGIEFAVNNRKS